MKKILFALLLLPVIASAQRLQYVNTYGYQYQRVVMDSLFAPPSDTFTVPTALQGYPFIARKGTGLYLWNTSTHVWAAVSGSGSTPTWQQTLTAGSTLTGNNTINAGSTLLKFVLDEDQDFTGFSGLNYSSLIGFQNGNAYVRMGNPSETNGGLNSTVGGATIFGQTVAAISSITTFADSIKLYPHLGRLFIDTLPNLSTQNTLLGWRQGATQGQVGYITLGSGLSLSSGQLTAASTSPPGNYGNIPMNRNGAYTTPASDSLSFNSAALNVKGDVGISDGRYLKIGGSNILNYSTGSNNATFAGAYNYIFNNGGNVFMNPATTTYFNAGTGDLYLSGSGSKIGIGTASPAASSLLDVSSTTKGVLIPRMTTTQRNAISTPAVGLMIYNTTDSAFNYYRASGWSAIGKIYGIDDVLAVNQSLTDDRFIDVNGNNLGINGGFSGIRVYNNGITEVGDYNGSQNYNRLAVDDGLSVAYFDNTAHNINIGINTITPSGALHVKANGGAIDALFVDNTTGNVGIGTATPNSTLHTNGSFAGKYTATATNLTLDETHYVVNVTVDGKTVTLPDAIGIEGRIYTIKFTDSGSCTVATTSSQNIDASTTYSLASQYKYVTVMSDNANWIVIANN